MEAAISNAEGNQTRVKVSIIARLIATVAFAIPAIGGALSSFLLITVFQALRSNEAVGIGAVMGGMKESSLPVTISLYLAAIFGLVVVIVLIVRMIMQTKKASPPFWFFVLGGILSFIPAALFWRAQLLVLEVLSPGSSIGAGGIGGVAEYIGELLLISVIAAPIVIVILIIASVVPFSSRPGPKVVSLVTAITIEIGLIVAAVGIPFAIDGPTRKNEIVGLPTNVKYADSDGSIEKENSLVLTLTADNKLYERQSRDIDGKVVRTETVITNQQLPDRIKRSMEDKTPDRRIVYFKCDVNASNENVLQVFEIIRKADVDKVGLVVVGEKSLDDPYQVAPLMFVVKLPAIEDETGGLPSKPVKPNPLTLVAKLENDGRLKLNNEDQGTVSDTKKLEKLLSRIFTEREDTGIFREGTNEIEKTVSVQVAKSTKYGDLIKLVQAVKLSRAEPIGIQMDELVSKIDF